MCAEWNGGGLPLWLATDVANFTCSRCDDTVWKTEMEGFVRAVADVMRPHLARVGGPIIMAQIENELHLSPSDPYVTWCGQLAAALDLDIPWVMCNGASANNTINACNGRYSTNSHVHVGASVTGRYESELSHGRGKQSNTTTV